VRIATAGVCSAQDSRRFFVTADCRRLRPGLKARPHKIHPDGTNYPAGAESPA